MRKSTFGAIAVAVGLILAAWGVLAVLGAAAQVSGGCYGAHPVSDFAIDHFLSLGPLIALGGLAVWLYYRRTEAWGDRGRSPGENESESPAAEHRNIDT
ncbi:hypothetical protein [Burkholderia sp. LMG 32019]|uniref:hypothetical protein n=1 Tax=Burkholderia sp. LMG 32019 TaxID=3158173 RepID=UPI003C2C230A